VEENMEKRLSAKLLKFLAAAFAAGGLAAAQAQDFPARPVKLVVWTAPGGSIDTLSRLIGEKLTPRWKQPVVVENKPGASGILASEYVAKAPADGHTLLVTINTTHINIPVLRANLPYDPVKDFEPVSQLAIGSVALIAPASHPAANLQDFVAQAKKKGGAVNYGSWGVGSSAHLFGTLLQQKTGLDMNHVAYKGEMPAITDMLGGRLDVTFAGGGTTRAQLEGGKIKVLGITGPRRVRALPNVATFAEQGFPGFELAGWVAVYAPARTPRDTIRKIAADIAAVVQTQEVQARMIENGFDPVGSTPEQFGALYREEYPKWKQLIMDSGAKVE
jgi:tripartite-type tricarboxylate transporter receptor subunit TctC